MNNIETIRKTAAVFVAAIIVAVLFPLSTLAADDASNLGEALKNGTSLVNLRYRFENVDDDNYDDEGRASTLRVGLGYSTKRWKGFSITAEIQSVLNVGMENEHNDKGAGDHWNEVADYPVIADPAVTNFYQGFLSWKFSKNSELKFGRQPILYDNVRFVGNVGWRQLHQSFDALRFTTALIPHLTLNYAFLWKQNRIFGDSKGMSTHLLNLGGTPGENNKLKGYAYLVDYDNPAMFGASTLTIGLHDEGSVALTSWKFLYDAEIALQKDAGDNPNKVDAGYYRGMLGAKIGGFSAKLSYEVLEGEAGKGAFSTPLATLHAWNGWSDMFLKTPINGLEDFYMALAYSTGAWKLSGIYHDFSAQTGGAHYGSEIDLVASWKSSWKQLFALKAAMYDADEYSRDVTKLWAFTSWKF